MGIGASEIAAIVGLNPYQTAREVWLTKTGRTQDFAGNFHTMRGQHLEPGIISWAKERWPENKIKPNRKRGKQKTYQRSVGGIVFATPDFFEMDSGNIVAVGDVKCPGWRTAKHWFDDAGELIFPDQYLAQVAWQACAVEPEEPMLQFYSAVAFIDGDIHYRKVPRDTEFEEMLLERAEHFWRHHVQKDIPPPLSEEMPENEAQALATWFQQNEESGGEMVQIGNNGVSEEVRQQLVTHIVEADALRGAIKDTKAKLEAKKNNIKNFLVARGADRLALREVSASYTRNRPRASIDFKAVAQEFAEYANIPDDIVERAVQNHTTEKAGSLVLRFDVKEGF